MLKLTWFYYIAGSPDPRSPRPESVKYRIGQVIRHKIWGYRGIIVGWDEQARVSVILKPSIPKFIPAFIFSRVIGSLFYFCLI